MNFWTGVRALAGANICAGIAALRSVGSYSVPAVSRCDVQDHGHAVSLKMEGDGSPMFGLYVLRGEQPRFYPNGTSLRFRGRRTLDSELGALLGEGRLGVLLLGSPMLALLSPIWGTASLVKDGLEKIYGNFEGARAFLAGLRDYLSEEDFRLVELASRNLWREANVQMRGYSFFGELQSVLAQCVRVDARDPNPSSSTHDERHVWLNRDGDIVAEGVPFRDGEIGINNIGPAGNTGPVRFGDLPVQEALSLGARIYAIAANPYVREGVERLLAYQANPSRYF